MKQPMLAKFSSSIPGKLLSFNTGDIELESLMVSFILWDSFPCLF